MAFQDILINIRSQFQGAGFERANDQLQSLQQQLQGLTSIGRGAEGLRTQANEANRVADALDRAGISISGGQFRQGGQFISTADGVEQLNQAMGENRMFAQGLSETVDNNLNPALRRVQQQSMPAVMDDAKGSMDEAAGSAEDFRFEWLSLMFAGMALSRVTRGLLKPALKATGAMDILTNTLKIFFLPAALFVTDVLLMVMDVMNSLPDEVQLFINALVGLGAVFGSLLTSVAMFELAMDGVVIAKTAGIAKTFVYQYALTGLSAAFSVVTGAASLFQGAVAALAGILGWPIVVIGGLILAVTSLAVAWENNLFDIRGITADVMGFIADQIEGVIDMIGMIPGVSLPPGLEQAIGGRASSFLRDTAEGIRRSRSNVSDNFTFFGMDASGVTGMFGNFFGGGGGATAPASPNQTVTPTNFGGNGAGVNQTINVNAPGASDSYNLRDAVSEAGRRGVERATTNF